MESNSVSDNGRSSENSDLLSRYMCFPKPDANLTQQNHKDLNVLNNISNLSQKQNTKSKNLPTLVDIQTEEELMIQVAY